MLTGQRTHHRTCPCGWEGAYTTPGYADKALRRHPCGDYTPRECGRHTHGSAAHSKHCGCPCWPCRRALLDQYEASAKARAYGRQRLVDATPALNHVLQLIHAGMGAPRIAEAAGVHRDTVERLARRKWRHGWETSRRISRATEAALLAVTYDPADGASGINSAPTVRRLRALVAVGWWPAELARATGLRREVLDRMLHGQAAVRPGTARRVHAAYKRLADLRAPSGTYADRARRQAAERGWTPPLRIAGRVVVGTVFEDPARRPGPRRAA